MDKQLEQIIENWYHKWMKDKGKSGSEAATINVLDMLKDFAAQSLPIQDIANGRDEVYYKWVKVDPDNLPSVDSIFRDIDSKEIEHSKVVDIDEHNLHFSYGGVYSITFYEWLKPVQSLPIEEGSEAIEFAEWIRENYEPEFVNGNAWVDILDSDEGAKEFSSKDLYQLFKNNQH